jgi:hypothetical protein
MQGIILLADSIVHKHSLTHLRQSKQGVPMAQTNSTLTHLECGNCGKQYEPHQLLNLCSATAASRCWRAMT